MTFDDKKKLLEAFQNALNALPVISEPVKPNAEILQKLKERKRETKLQDSPALDDVLLEIECEVASAESKWPPMNSAHEAYAVLLEEVDELWDHVKTNQKKRDLDAMRAEAIQVAAMAVRFVRDVCDGDRGRK